MGYKRVTATYGGIMLVWEEAVLPLVLAWRLCQWIDPIRALAALLAWLARLAFWSRF